MFRKQQLQEDDSGSKRSFVSLQNVVTAVLVLGAAIAIGQNLLAQPPLKSLENANYVNLSPDRLGELFAAVELDDRLTTSKTTHASVEPALPEPPASASDQEAGQVLFDQKLAKVQGRLALLGYLREAVTGKQNTATREAIFRFEVDNDLVPDGRIDAEMMARLEFLAQIYEATKPASNSNSQRMSFVQSSLADLGYRPGRASGQMSAATKAAIEQFQRDRGLVPSGEINAELLDALENVTRTAPSQ